MELNPDFRKQKGGALETRSSPSQNTSEGITVHSFTPDPNTTTKAKKSPCIHSHRNPGESIILHSTTLMNWSTVRYSVNALALQVQLDTSQASLTPPQRPASN